MLLTIFTSIKNYIFVSVCAEIINENKNANGSDICIWMAFYSMIMCLYEYFFLICLLHHQVSVRLLAKNIKFHPRMHLQPYFWPKVSSCGF